MDNSGEWKTIPTKEARQKEVQMKKKKKEEEINKKRDIERREYQEKQDKINKLFENSSKAFDLKKEPKKKYSGHWEVLEEDVEDFTETHKDPKQKQLDKLQYQKDNGFVFTSVLDKQKREKQKQQKLRAKLNNSGNDVKNNTQQQVSKSLSKAIETFDVASYVNLLNTVDTKYPKIIEIQVKLIAECLEEHFGTVENESINNNSTKNIDYLSHFKKNNKFKNETVKYFEGCKNNIKLIPSIVFLVNNLVSIYRKEKNAVQSSGVGLEILLQLIFKCFPETLLKLASTFKSLNLPNQKLPLIQLIVWFFSQPLTSEPKVSLQLWFEIVFPIFMHSSKNKISDTVIGIFDEFSQSVFDNLKLKSHIDIDSEILSTSLDTLLFTLQNEKYLPPMALKYSYSLLETKLLFPNGKVPSKYFLVLLNNAAIPDQQFRDTILEESVKCLRVHHACFQYIKDNYNTYIAQVNNLLLYINNRYDELHLQNQIPKSLVLDLATFAMTENQKLLVQCQDSKVRKTKGLIPKEIEMCNATCQTVITNFTPSKASKYFKLFILFISIPITIGISAYLSVDYICKNQQHIPKQYQSYSNYICQ
ncbi:hypothetical protein DLAC_08392 [Tieghemostelium lacteum]|uniref:Transmembrane protein n=1 Tax=Tieghemostelium lacteum TaxID=361077 RepID=A0A151ZBV0_TIELA|nr:hypothetical protein DLAC_08392 [Tieghemostelium lacteum]|eukprot:KYQ91427.1 hypothetical protein DLAC_08392 [Tieghemostelium lacteum]